jgi:UDP-galactopyranose mutase
MPHVQRTKGLYHGEVYSLPINLHTINQLYRENLSPAEAKQRIHIETLGRVRPQDARNFEEFGIGSLGPRLYDAFIRGYTEKQWGIDPRELPASILKRLPFRTDYNDNAFFHKYQGIPRGGYTEAVKNMLDFPDISIRLGTKFDPDTNEARTFHHVFYTGPLDEWFSYKFGPLRYRTLDLQRITRLGVQDLQGCAVMNNCDPETKWTRRTEHKHFTPWETHTGTVITQEVPRDWQHGDTHFYPMRLDADKAKLAQYETLAARETRTTFVGRLATYRYLDMDQCIKEAIEAASKFYRADNGYPPLDTSGRERIT